MGMVSYDRDAKSVFNKTWGGAVKKCLKSTPSCNQSKKSVAISLALALASTRNTISPVSGLDYTSWIPGTPATSCKPVNQLGVVNTELSTCFLRQIDLGGH